MAWRFQGCQAGKAPPWVRARDGRCQKLCQDGGEFLLRPLKPTYGLKLVPQNLMEFQQVVHVQRSVLQPGFGQWTRGPVVCGMCLFQPDAKLAFEKGTEASRRLPQKSCGKFGIEQCPRADSGITHARQILAGGMHQPERVSAGF